MRKTGLQLSLESKYLRPQKKKGSPIGLPFS